MLFNSFKDTNHAIMSSLLKITAIAFTCICISIICRSEKHTSDYGNDKFEDLMTNEQIRLLESGNLISLNYHDSIVWTGVDSISIFNANTYSFKNGMENIRYWFAKKDYAIKADKHNDGFGKGCIIVYSIGADLMSLDKLYYNITDNGETVLTAGIITVANTEVSKVPVGSSSKNVLNSLSLKGFEPAGLETIVVERSDRFRYGPAKVPDCSYYSKVKFKFNCDTLVSIEIGDIDNALKNYQAHRNSIL